MPIEDSTSVFNFESRPADSPLVESVWRTQSLNDGSFVSTAETHWEMVIAHYQGALTVTIRGPETQARHAPFLKDTEYFGIVFKHGTFMPHLPVNALANEEVNLPPAAHGTFWLQSAAWELPSFENADEFVNHLARKELLVFDPVVEAVLKNRPLDLSPRTVQRRFLRATGLTPKTFQQIERAHQAMTLLQQGVPILDTVCETGYFDQSHLTNSLKRFIGQTPVQIVESNRLG